MLNPAPRIKSPLRAVRLDLTLSDASLTNGGIEGFATITGGIVSANTVYACHGSIENINGTKSRYAENVILVLETESDSKRAAVRLLMPSSNHSAIPLLTVPKEVHVEFAVTTSVNSQTHRFSFYDDLVTLQGALR